MRRSQQTRQLLLECSHFKATTPPPRPTPPPHRTPPPLHQQPPPLDQQPPPHQQQPPQEDVSALSPSLSQPASPQTSVVVGRPSLYAIAREQFELLECIGGGSFGRVHKGVLYRPAPALPASSGRKRPPAGSGQASDGEGGDSEDEEGELVAVKELTAASKGHDFARQAQEYYTEAELLSECSHINIAQLYGVCVQAPTFYMLMEYAAGGPLSSLLSRTTLKPSVIVDWALQMARGMNYLHCECRAACVVHRDLKSPNILLAKVGTRSSGRPQCGPWPSTLPSRPCSVSTPPFFRFPPPSPRIL